MMPEPFDKDAFDLTEDAVVFTNVDPEIVEWIREIHSWKPLSDPVIFNGVLKDSDGPRP